MPSQTSAHKFFFHDQGQFLYHDVKDAVGDVSGVYYLHLIDEDGNFRSIPHLLDDDGDGILYIGTAAKLHERLGELQKAVSVAYGLGQWTNSRHGVLGKLRNLPRFTQRFSNSALCVTVEALVKTVEGDPNTEFIDHYGIERRRLTEYRERYGSYPMLNVQ